MFKVYEKSNLVPEKVEKVPNIGHERDFPSNNSIISDKTDRRRDRFEKILAWVGTGKTPGVGFINFLTFLGPHSPEVQGSNPSSADFLLLSSWMVKIEHFWCLCKRSLQMQSAAKT